MATTTLYGLEQCLDELNHFMSPLPPWAQAQLVEDYVTYLESKSGVQHSRRAARHLTPYQASEFWRLGQILDRMFAEIVAARASDALSRAKYATIMHPYNTSGTSPIEASAAVL
jgi:hypothetical protein